MSLPWNAQFDNTTRSSNSRRTKETWILRGFVLMAIFNLIILYKLYHPETITPLDDFQTL